MWRRSVVARFSAREAPSRRPRPAPRVVAPRAAPLDVIRQADVSCAPPPWRRGAAGLAVRCRAAEHLRAGACRARARSASKISSNFSQSEWVAQNSARSAGLQRRRPRRRGRRQDRQRVARLGEADLEAVVAQRADEARQAPPRRAPPIAFAILAQGYRPSHATLPSSRSVTSRVSRARSSWVLSRQIMVSWTASGSCRRSCTSRPGERRRPVERLGDARHLAQVLLADRRHHARDLQRQRRVDAGQCASR